LADEDLNADIVRKLESLPVKEWSGTVYRHMFGDLRPDRENTRGARWNPPETPAIYSSLERKTAVAEGKQLADLHPIEPSVERKIYTIKVRLSRVIDLSDWNVLRELGVERELFDADDYTATQLVGGSAEWLGCDGMIVPSAREEGFNLVVFPRKAEITDYFDAVYVEVLES
jgi:RES domain-containing protein